MTPTTWMGDAACLGFTPLFFPPDHFERQTEQASREARALAICARCPVRPDCRTHLLANRELYRDAVMAGSTPGDRNVKWKSTPLFDPAPALLDDIDRIYAPSKRGGIGSLTIVKDDPRDLLVRQYIAEQAERERAELATAAKADDAVVRSYQLQLGVS